MSSAIIRLLKKITTGIGLEIAKGNIEGHSSISKFGENPDVDAAEDLIVQGGTYTFSSTANVDSLSSSVDTDTQDITIEGLADGFIPSIQTIALDGHTPVFLSPPLIRSDRMLNANGTNFDGDIYIYINGATVVAGVPQTATEIRNKIVAGDNQTLMGIYTVPAGKTGYLFSYGVSLSKLTPATALTCSIRIRPFEGVFLVKDRGAAATTGATNYRRDFTVPLPLPEKTDIKIVIDTVTAANTGVSGHFDIILVDN